MSVQAKVESIEPLKALRRTMFKFADSINTALADSESELTRTLLWITTEQTTYWTMQIRKRTELVSRCEEAVRMKKIFKDAAGSRSSAVDEMKKLEAAKRALVQAHEKAANCKTWTRKLEKEIQNYRGVVQRLATTVQGQLPVHAAKLQNAIIRLEQYFALGAPSEQASTGGTSEIAPAPQTDAAGSMARPEADEEQKSPDSARDSGKDSARDSGKDSAAVASDGGGDGRL
jgi:hypothetical protein